VSIPSVTAVVYAGGYFVFILAAAMVSLNQRDL